MSDTVTRYVPAYKNADGYWTLMRRQQGGDTFETADAAAAWLRAVRQNNTEALVASVWGQAPAFAVCRCACYPGHFDPTGIYFEETDIVEGGQGC